VPAALRSSKQGLAAGRAMVTLAYRTRPFNTALLVTEQRDLFAPNGDRILHHPSSCSETEVLDYVAGPVRTLMA